MTAEKANKIADKLATIISIVFHPLFIPLYGLGILFSAPTFLASVPFQVKKILFLIVLMNNVLVPLAFLPFFRTRNIISSYRIESRNERVIPLVTGSILYFITSFIYFRFPVPEFFKSFIFAVTVLAVMITIINFWFKISIHAACSGALAALVLALAIRTGNPLIWYLISVILAGGLILSSRLRLMSHSPSQVWIGFFTGLAGSAASFLLF